MISTKKRIIRIFGWLVSLSIMLFIFMSSSQTAQVSSNTSGGLIKAVLSIAVPDFEDLSATQSEAIIESYQRLVRKAAHFSVFMLLGASVFTTVYTYSVAKWLKYFVSLTICLFYAISDELHQVFIPGRGPLITDVFIDFAGVVTGVLIITLIISLLIKRRKKKMRKKELMRRLEDLVKTVERLNRRVKELTEERDELKNRVTVLEEQKETPIEIEKPSFLTVDANVSDAQTNESSGFVVKVVDEVELDPNSDIDDNELNIMEYGAAIIGKITVESAKCCDIITKNGGNDVKELLGLVMGKSELSKSEILNIAMSEADDTAKRSLIDTELEGAVEYFKSVSEQNS